MRYNDYSIIENNIKKISKTNEICLVVKNDAYGFKIDKIVPLAVKNNVNFFAVNNLTEALEVRKYSDGLILLIENNRSVLYKNLPDNILPNASSIDDITYYENNQIPYAVELDDGMNRFGLKSLEVISDGLKYIRHIYVHFHMNRKENYDWITILKTYKKNLGISISFGGSLIYGYTNECLRLGRMVYSDSISFYGNVINIKEIDSFESVGYDECYRANSKQKIAILDVGYFNGLNPDFKGYVYCNGKYYRVVGKLCMNQTFVLIDDLVNIGDKMEFLGSHIRSDIFLNSNKSSEYCCFLLLK